MKSLLTIVAVLILILWISGCRQQTNIPVDEDSSPVMKPEDHNQDSQLPPYDPASDLTLLGGDAAVILGDTMGIKMYVYTMNPGDSVGFHAHPDHTIYVLEGGTLAVYFEGLERQIFELPTGTALISPAVSDAAVNIGTTAVRMLTHDIYRPGVAR